MSKRSRTCSPNVPVELLHRIQFLLPLKDAARTCILSKSWLHAWYTIPNLRFNPHGPLCSLFSSICSTLQRYHRDNIPIESFHLELNIARNQNQKDAESWIRLAASKSSLKDLSLNIRLLSVDTLTLPNELFSSQSLSTIKVKHATDYAYHTRQLQICTNPVINCVSLRVMDLERVFITQGVFYNLLSTCTLLEKIRHFYCKGLKTVKVKNLLRLCELDILSIEDDFWEINNVPSLRSFSYRHLFDRRKPLPFQMDSLPSVTHLHIDGVIIDKLFLDIVETKFPLLESLTLRFVNRELENMVITSASLKWLTLDVSYCGLVDAKICAPRLLSFTHTGNIPHLVFPNIAPEKIKLTYRVTIGGNLWIIRSFSR